MKILYYHTHSGRSPLEKFIAELSENTRADIIDALAKLANGEKLIMPLNRPLATIHPGLHELRLKDGGVQIRIFYYIKKGEAIYMTHAIRKKTQEIPTKEIRLILNRIREIK